MNSICIGNLSVGGTGKSPHVDFLVNHFHEKGLNVSTLSRGYGRKTKGLLEVTNKHSSEEVGDEPLMYKLKYGDQLKVIVSEKRIEGVKYLQNSDSKTGILIFDDAFQHRAVRAKINILLTDYHAPFYNDMVLPAGNLREWQSGKKRADIIIVTKCPSGLIENIKKEVRSKLHFDVNRIFFSEIIYGEITPFSNAPKPESVETILLVTGIANPKPLVNHLNIQYNVELMQFPDHHIFTTSEIQTIHDKYASMNPEKSIILTTEKDFVRLKSNSSLLTNKPWNYIPITIQIDRLDDFFRQLEM